MALAASADSRVVQDMNMDSEISAIEDMLRKADDDICELCFIIGQYKINRSNLKIKTPKQARNVIQEYIDTLKRQNDRSSNKLKSNGEMLFDCLRNELKLQLKCKEFYKKVEAKLHSQKECVKCSLELQCANYQNTLSKRQLFLGEKRVKILVTGEISAGKSSILNLLMGGNYMAVGHGHCTRISCEVQYSHKPEATLYYESSMERSITISENEEDPIWSILRECMEKGVDVMMKRDPDQDPEQNPAPKLKKICIHWKLPFLVDKNVTDVNQKESDKQNEQATEVNQDKSANTDEQNKNASEVNKHESANADDQIENVEEVNPDKSANTDDQDKNVTDVTQDESANTDDEVLYGVTFIDVPGIHDTEETFVNIHEYIQSSDAFLFVINTSQHAGIDKDRLLRLMSDVRNIFEKKYGLFSPSCGLFVCNKWDMVEEEVRPGLRKEVFQKLSAEWPRVTEKQIVPLTSSLQVVKCVRFGKFNEEYVQFFNSLCSFVGNAVRLKTELSASWLSTILDKTIATVQSKKDVVIFAKTKQKEILEQLRMEEETILATINKIAEIERSLNEFIRVKKDHLKKYLAHNLEDNKQNLATWHISSIPTHQEGNWMNTNRTIIEEIVQRIENHITADSHVQLVLDQTNKTVHKDLEIVSKLCDELENSLAFCSQKTGVKTNPENLTESGVSWKDIAGILVALVFPLAPIVVLIVDAVDRMMTSSLLNDENKFLENSSNYMSRQTSILLEQMIKSPEALFNKYVKTYGHLFQQVLGCLKNRHQMTIALTSDIKLKQPITPTKDLEKLSDNLLKFFVNDILRPDVDKQLISYNRKKDLLKRGAFGKVYKGLYKHVGDTYSTPVAVKVIKMPENQKPEDCFCFRECFVLRMLSVKPAVQRTHVVEYLGHYLEDSHRLCLVFELCDSSLDELIQKKNDKKKLKVPDVIEVDFPGQDTTGTKGADFVLHLAEQAATGVRFLHDYKVVHRDIKPQNFLIKVIETYAVVKVCDFGLARQEDMIKTQGTGTILYNAPEIFAHQPHTFASDIYSLGLVFWELWYGQKVFEDLSDNEIKKPNRKPPEMRDVRPLERYRALLMLMFKAKPELRPNIDTIVRTLKDVRQKFRRGEI